MRSIWIPNKMKLKLSRFKKWCFVAVAAYLYLFIYLNSADSLRKRLYKRNGLKFILQWTNARNVPFNDMGEGQAGFISRKCPYNNCYVTSDRNLLSDITEFDVIAFAGPELGEYSNSNLPTNRAPHQKYAFASIESSDNYPICNKVFDNFFNWTWTYKLDSDVRWGYIVIRDKFNTIIGPKTVMHWLKLNEMDPVPEELKYQMKTKRKAAAWLVSNCNTLSGREAFVDDLIKHLSKYNLYVDVYGDCGPFRCSHSDHDKCMEIIEKDYYFYLSFENAFSEDYVTEKLLHGLQNNIVPIVYGGANYSRFMPDGIYLNALELGADALAKKMWHLIKNPEEYAQYFRWKKHYSYHSSLDSVETNEYCKFCSILNDENTIQTKKVYENFRKWWTPPDIKFCFS